MISENTPKRSIRIEESDLSHVRKGSFMPHEWCARFIGVSPNKNSDEYQLGLLALQDRVERLLCKRDNDFSILVRQYGLGLQVLNDEETVVHSGRRQRIAIRHWRKMLAKQQAIDDSKLPPNVRALLHHQLNVNLRLESALKRALQEEAQLKKARNSSSFSHLIRPPRNP